MKRFSQKRARINSTQKIDLFTSQQRFLDRPRKRLSWEEGHQFPSDLQLEEKNRIHVNSAVDHSTNGHFFVISIDEKVSSGRPQNQGLLTRNTSKNS